jgi:glycosyltransferase involved in cell wall biosynthesis
MTKILMTLEKDFPNDERVEKEALSLLKHGFEIHLLCYTIKNKVLYEKYKGIHIHRFKISNFTYKSSALSLQFPFYFNKWRKEFTSLLKVEKFDFVHIHDLPLVSIIEPLKGKYSFKTILDLHENWPVLMKISEFTSKFPINLFFSFKKWVDYETKWIKKVDHIIVVIEEAKERLEKLGISKEKITIIQNTIELDFFKLNKSNPSFELPKLLYSGGVNKHRGLQIVLKALSILREQGIVIEFHIVGTGRYMNDLKKQSFNLGIEDQFIDNGWKNFQEMMEEINQAQILIIPHIKSEHTDATIPNKLFQYFYASKPLIVSNCKPLERIVKQEKAGYVYENYNANDLAEILKNISKNYNSHIELSKNNKEIVLEKYNWKVEEKKLINLYLNIKGN